MKIVKAWAECSPRFYDERLYIYSRNVKWKVLLYQDNKYEVYSYTQIRIL